MVSRPSISSIISAGEECSERYRRPYCPTSASRKWSGVHRNTQLGYSLKKTGNLSIAVFCLPDGLDQISSGSILIAPHGRSCNADTAALAVVVVEFELYTRAELDYCVGRTDAVAVVASKQLPQDRQRRASNTVRCFRRGTDDFISWSGDG